jgi:hypothetical protein
MTREETKSLEVSVADFAVAFSRAGVVDTGELAPLQSSDAMALGEPRESEAR